MCPSNKCKALIAFIAEEINTDVVDISGLFEPEEGTTKEETDAVKQFECPSCREKFVRVNGHISFHTNYGWT